MRTRRWMAAPVLALVVSTAAHEAQALHRPVVRVGVGPRFHYGPVVRPVGFRSPHVVRIERVNYGSVDFNIEPQDARVFVDGRLLGIADDFNGWPQTAKLPPGYHDVRVETKDGRRDERRIFVAAGAELNFNLRF